MKRLCALLGIVIALTGCAAGGQPASPVAAPVSTKPSPTPIKPVPAPKWSVKQAHLVSPSLGWVLATSAAKPDALAVLRTADGGKGWQDVTPSGLAQSAVVDFTDENRGWAAFQQNREGKSEMVVMRTGDGGHSWSRTAFPVLPWEIVPWFTFDGPQSGWLVVTSTPALGMMHKSVFHTADAGATWQVVSRGGGQGGTPTAEHLPDNEYVTGVTFPSAAEGWVSAQYRALAEVPLYHTVDGGRTWHRQSIAYPDTGSRISYCDAYPPRFFGQERINARLLLQCRGKDGEWIVPYATRDSGQHWGYRTPVPGGIHNAGSYDFTDSEHAWVLMDSGVLQVTKDAGWTWEQVATLPASGGKISFADERAGWLLQPDGKLSATVDGGRTWTPLTVTTH